MSYETFGSLYGDEEEMMLLIYYWNLVRLKKPNIQIRLYQFEKDDGTHFEKMGEAHWLSCCLQDQAREMRLGDPFFGDLQ